MKRKQSQKKTLPEWLSSGTTTRKLRELLTQDFQINKSRSAKFMMTYGLAALFHFDTTDLKDKYIPGTLNVYRTGDDMCYISVGLKIDLYQTQRGFSGFLFSLERVWEKTTTVYSTSSLEM